MMDEKVLPRTKRFNAVTFCLTAIRIWQWSSSFFVFGSFSLLYAQLPKSRLGEDNNSNKSRLKAVEILGLITLIYTTIIICGVHICKTLGLRSWRIFIIASFVGDLTIMGLCIAKITLLSLSGLPTDCHGLRHEIYDSNDLVRQPADGRYGTIRFGSWATSMTGELDSWCTFPRTVYGLSVVAIFSYTFSLLLSTTYIQQIKEEALECATNINTRPNSPRLSLRSVGEHCFSPMRASFILDLDLNSGSDAPSLLSSQHIFSRTSSRQGSTRSTRTSSTSSRNSSWGGITLGSSEDTESLRSGGSLPPLPIPGSSRTPQRRWSTSTTSSFNANTFIVTDGFRPAPEESLPPAYESRPGSLYNETMKYPAGIGMPGVPKP